VQKNNTGIYAKKENSIPLFCQDWWMDAVCLDEWDVLLVEEKGQIVAALPYHLRKKLGFRCIVQPQLTQYNGIWIRKSRLPPTMNVFPTRRGFSIS